MGSRRGGRSVEVKGHGGVLWCGALKNCAGCSGWGRRSTGRRSTAYGRGGAGVSQQNQYCYLLFINAVRYTALIPGTAVQYTDINTVPTDTDHKPACRCVVLQV